MHISYVFPVQRGGVKDHLVSTACLLMLNFIGRSSDCDCELPGILLGTSSMEIVYMII